MAVTAIYIPIENDSKYLKSFNPMAIYKDAFRIEKNDDNEKTKINDAPDMTILSRILDQADIPDLIYNEKPRSSSSYDPAWFVM